MTRGFALREALSRVEAANRFAGHPAIARHFLNTGLSIPSHDDDARQPLSFCVACTSTGLRNDH